MAPKAAKAPPPTALPVVDDEVPWPEGVEPIADPPFRSAVAHVVGHLFVVEGDAVEGSDALPPLQDFDPCGLVLTKLKDDVVEDPLSKRVVHVCRADLEPLAEGGPISGALLKKVQAEILARHRRKVNRARTRHLEEAKADDPASRVGSKTDQGHGDDELDLVLMLLGFPDTVEELNEVRDAGGFELGGSWTTVYLAGHTVEEVDAEEGAEPAADGAARRRRKACEVPPLVASVYDAIHEAPLGSGLANSTVRTVACSHEMALPSGGEADRVLDTILASVRSNDAQRRRFDEWLGGALRIRPPPAPRLAEPADMVVYERLVDAVNVAHHDVAFLLSCMCEQVAASLKGDAHDKPAGENGVDAQLDELTVFLDEAHEQLLLGPGEATRGDSDCEGEVSAPPVEQEQDGSLVIPRLDFVACNLYGVELPGNVPAIDEVQRLLAHLQAPGVRRAGFPENIKGDGKAARTAACNRIYNSLPEMPTVEIERMLLLREFELMLERAQPERSWCLKDRVFHERIPSSVLIQTLVRASQLEQFIETAYMQRHDCLLIALHHRALPGRLLWYSWLAHAGQSGAGADKDLCLVPTFNDWGHFVAKDGSNDKTAAAAAGQTTPALPARATLLEFDARELGYCKLLEKVHVPADGSVVFRTSYRRGLKETFPRPSSGPDPVDVNAKGDDESSDDDFMDSAEIAAQAGETEAAAPFSPRPRSETLRALVVKDGLTFGIATDETWRSFASQLRETREERERAATEKAAAAEAERAEKAAMRAAQGLPPEDDEEDAECGDSGANATQVRAGKASERDSVTHLRLEDLVFGKFYVAFPDGARCTFRIHHERPWWAEGETTFDPVAVQPGVFATYTTTTGTIVQVFSDAVVRQVSPVRPRAQASATAATAAKLGKAGELGGPEDPELSRHFTPFGVLIIELLSGRREVYYPDGVRAVRNPTLPEIQERLKSSAYGSAPERDALERFAASLGALETAKAKAAGLAGHWRVVSANGQVFGRAQAAPERPQSEKWNHRRGSGASVAPRDDGGVRGDEDVGGEDQDETAGEEEEMEPAMSPAAILLDTLGGMLVDGGKTVEYEVEPLPVVEHVDPHTGQQLTTGKDGHLMYSDARGNVTTCILPDGTHMVRTLEESGYTVVVEKGGSSRVACTVNDRGTTARCFSVAVMCEDGTELEVQPQSLNFNGFFVPADPSIDDPATVSTNASVAVKHRMGSVVTSRGSGEVDVQTSFTFGGDLGATLDRGKVYSARVDKDTLGITDRDGNSFTVHGDQTVRVQLSGSRGDDFASPRCVMPGLPYKHPDAEFLPLPESPLEPLLFVVYGDGEAEEVMPTREAREALRLASLDQHTVIVEEQMGAPMEMCRCHTILRSVPAKPQVAAAIPPPLDMPPIAAGCLGGGYGAGSVGGGGGGFCSGRASLQPQLGATSRRSTPFTEFRQFVEYPAVDEATREAFLQAKAQHEEEEDRHRRLHAAYGAGEAQEAPAPAPRRVRLSVFAGGGDT
eukprot:TRINITY_DN74830_c0_g1_i1.p1 TRINITY_DN74830_c0_g1~~TRINITY_DN74830_c0_g1_i1.p1  ORF type:complete len:1500 (+),score=349.88 TRINITY_DN74830_c0_g1_i1:71-4570(+)